MEKIDLKSKNFKNCIHTKNIFSLIDLDEDIERAQFLNQHLNECDQCKKSYKYFKEKMFAAATFIPKPHMDRELKDTFDRELSELLKSLNINDSVVRKKMILNKLNTANIYAETIVKLAFSKTMFVSYGVAGILYLLFRFQIIHS